MSENHRPCSRKKRTQSGQLLASLLFSCLIIGAVWTAYVLNLLSPIDHYLYDFHFRLRGPLPVSDRIVLVLMDDRSAMALNRQKGHWSRSQTARALSNLCRAGAEVIGIDMVMADPDPDPAADRMMAETIRACNNVVLPRVAVTQSGDVRRAIDLFQTGIIGEGFVDAQLDADGVWRRMNYFSAAPLENGAVEIVPAFSLELVRTFFYMDIVMGASAPGRSDKEDIVMVSEEGKKISLPQPELLINYHGDITAFERISYCDVVNDRFDAETVRGKLVIIGSSLAVNKDMFFTPMSGFEKKSRAVDQKFKKVSHGEFAQKDFGVSCIAHAAENILSGTMLRKLPVSWFAFLAGLFILSSLLFYHPKINFFFGILILVLMLAGGMAVRHGLFVYGNVVFDPSPLLLITGLQYVSSVSIQKVFASRKAARVTSMFGQYVSKAVATELVEGDVDAILEGSQQELTILFSDLRNFTSLSEKMAPHEVRLLLNTFFGAMIPLVIAHKGTLDKLVGDMVMAFYGAPLPVPEHPVKAAQTALAMRDTLKKMRQDNTVRGMDALWAGIGINTGPVIVGNLGSEQFIDYTVIGDTVNLASRLEGLNKVYGTEIIISESTANELGDRFLTRKLDRVQVKGRKDAVTIFELRGTRSDASEQEITRLRLFESGLAAYQAGDFDAARGYVEQVLADDPLDGPSLLFIERITALAGSPLPGSWDGVTHLTFK